MLLLAVLGLPKYLVHEFISLYMARRAFGDNMTEAVCEALTLMACEYANMNICYSWE
jgi:hypothetical protein